MNPRDLIDEDIEIIKTHQLQSVTYKYAKDRLVTGLPYARINTKDYAHIRTKVNKLLRHEQRQILFDYYNFYSNHMGFIIDFNKFDSFLKFYCTASHSTLLHDVTFAANLTSVKNRVASLDTTINLMSESSTTDEFYLNYSLCRKIFSLLILEKGVDRDFIKDKLKNYIINVKERLLKDSKLFIFPSKQCYNNVEGFTDNYEICFLNYLESLVNDDGEYYQSLSLPLRSMLKLDLDNSKRSTILDCLDCVTTLPCEWLSVMNQTSITELGNIFIDFTHKFPLHKVLDYCKRCAELIVKKDNKFDDNYKNKLIEFLDILLKNEIINEFIYSNQIK